VHDKHRFRILFPSTSLWLSVLGLLCVSLASCGFPHSQPRRAETYVGPGGPQPNRPFSEKALPAIYATLPVVADAEYVNDDELCLSCHKVYAESMQQNIHRGIHQEGQACEACHGPASRHLEARGKEPGLILNPKKLEPAEAAELCLRCHEQDACAPGAQWRTSTHAHNNLTCITCHTAHYNVPPGTPPTTEPGEEARDGNGAPISLVSFEAPQDIETLRAMSNNLGAQAPDTCYRCHGDLAEAASIAGPHQICGPNGFNCTTCHDAHGSLLEYSRKDLCLECHERGSPTMAWHSSIHELNGVSCTDCHNPHPNPNVPQVVNVSHTNIFRPKRLPMSVQDPQTCYKCHPQIYALNSLPSHHPILEGKMVCGDCHDAHGQREGNLNAERLNLLCWKCHADKQGPFAYEHPPVTENCGICHNPHGTVTNNLLKQPPTFLCLRCHTGHRRSSHGYGAGDGYGDRVDIDAVPDLRQAYYTDCTNCHTQIHGSDLPNSEAHPNGLMR